MPRGGAARARPGSGRTTQPFLPARRARYPPARIFHQSRGLPRATPPGCQRGCRADLAGHDPGRNGQTYSIARLRRDRDPKPNLNNSIDPPGGPSSGPPVLQDRRPVWNSLLERKILHAIRANMNISLGLGKVFREALFGNLAFSFAPSRRVPISRGAAKPPRRARGRRARGPQGAGAGRSRTPGSRGAKVRSGSARDREARARSTVDRALTPTLPQRPRAVPAVRRRAARSNLAPPRVRRPQNAPSPTLTPSPPRPALSRAAPAAVTILRHDPPPPRRANP